MGGRVPELDGEHGAGPWRAEAALFPAAAAVLLTERGWGNTVGVRPGARGWDMAGPEAQGQGRREGEAHARQDSRGGCAAGAEPTHWSARDLGCTAPAIWRGCLSFKSTVYFELDPGGSRHCVKTQIITLFGKSIGALVTGRKN